MRGGKEKKRKIGFTNQMLPRVLCRYILAKYETVFQISLQPLSLFLTAFVLSTSRTSGLTFCRSWKSCFESICRISYRKSSVLFLRKHSRNASKRRRNAYTIRIGRHYLEGNKVEQLLELNEMLSNKGWDPFGQVSMVRALRGHSGSNIIRLQRTRNVPI